MLYEFNSNQRDEGFCDLIAKIVTYRNNSEQRTGRLFLIELCVVLWSINHGKQ